ncbi:hypothetical protein ON010_g9406 [Phytophthora cinnamomi]|nr:hypothetical protein ON010_g9406 [Phytophthora cinnamomi]
MIGRCSQAGAQDCSGGAGAVRHSVHDAGDAYGDLVGGGHDARTDDAGADPAASAADQERTTATAATSTEEVGLCRGNDCAHPGKTGRIVAAPQIYGQELFSVYIDEHEALFQVPFNALTLIARPTPTQQPQTTQQMQAQLAAAGGRLLPNQMPQNGNVQAVRGSKSAEQIKMEHSFQLHRLMQQQYREIQSLQQRYAECRIMNPTALSGIQKELSKLRLVHLSQVQTLKSKQALDMIGK